MKVTESSSLRCSSSGSRLKRWEKDNVIYYEEDLEEEGKR
jgi:hypothetical protein